MASIDIDRLSKMLKEKRGKMNLRDTAKAGLNKVKSPIYLPF